MKRLKWLLYLMFLLIICAEMTGCYDDGKLISISPDPSESVQLELDGKQIFHVESTAGFHQYSWYTSDPINHMIKLPFQITNTYRYTVAPEDMNHKYLRVTVFLKTFKNGPIIGSVFSGWHWEVTDTRSWEITFIQNPPVWQGDYIVENSSDIEALKDYYEVTGHLIIRGYPSFSSLADIGHITSIGGGLYISASNVLTSLDGLNSELTSIGGSLSISSNGALTSLGLDNLISVDGNLYIRHNTILPTSLAEDLLDRITIGGSDIIICGNLDGEPCLD